MALLTAVALTKNTISGNLRYATIGTAFTDTSSHTFYIPREGKTILVINNTYAGTTTVTVAAGAYIGAKALTLTVAQNYDCWADISGFTSKAFGAGTDSTGTDVGGVVTITFSTSGTGFVNVVTLPN
jgi:hypothetical protein